MKRQSIRPEFTKVVKHVKLESVDYFYVNLGRGDISIAQMSAMMHEFDETQRNKDSIPVRAKALHKPVKKTNSSVNVLGVGNLLTTIANCCMPVPHDDIVGFITKDRGVSVHRKDCNNILYLKDKDQARLIEVEWGDTDIQNYPVNIVIQANDRHGLLSDITRTLSDDKVNVIAVNTM